MPPDPLVGVAYGHTSFGLTSINLAIAPLQTEHFVQNYLCAQSELAEFLAYLCSCILVQTNKLIKYSQPWHCQTEHFVQNYLCAQSELAEFLAYLCSCILVQTNKLIKYSQPWHCQTEHFVQKPTHTFDRHAAYNSQSHFCGCGLSALLVK